jgi:hypothetical protein
MDNQTEVRKVWGSGFHAGKKANPEGNRPWGGFRNTAIFDATTGVLCWKPGTAEVAVVSLTEYSEGYKSIDGWHTALAAMLDVRKMEYGERRIHVLSVALGLIVRDKCDPAAVHRALMNVHEYQDGIPLDAHPN